MIFFLQNLLEGLYCTILQFANCCYSVANLFISIILISLQFLLILNHFLVVLILLRKALEVILVLEKLSIYLSIYLSNKSWFELLSFDLFSLLKQWMLFTLRDGWKCLNLIHTGTTHKMLWLPWICLMIDKLLMNFNGISLGSVFKPLLGPEGALECVCHTHS